MKNFLVFSTLTIISILVISLLLSFFSMEVFNILTTNIYARITITLLSLGVSLSLIGIFGVSKCFIIETSCISSVLKVFNIKIKSFDEKIKTEIIELSNDEKIKEGLNLLSDKISSWGIDYYAKKGIIVTYVTCDNHKKLWRRLLNTKPELNQ